MNYLLLLGLSYNNAFDIICNKTTREEYHNFNLIQKIFPTYKITIVIGILFGIISPFLLVRYLLQKNKGSINLTITSVINNLKYNNLLLKH